MSQIDVPVDVRTITNTASRPASKAWRRDWPVVQKDYVDQEPKPVVLEYHKDTGNIH